MNEHDVLAKIWKRTQLAGEMANLRDGVSIPLSKIVGDVCDELKIGVENRAVIATYMMTKGEPLFKEKLFPWISELIAETRMYS